MAHENALLRVMEEKVFEMANAVDMGVLELDVDCIERLAGDVTRIMASQCADCNELVLAALAFLSAETPGDYENSREFLASRLMEDMGYARVYDYEVGIDMWVKKEG